MAAQVPTHHHAGQGALVFVRLFFNMPLTAFFVAVHSNVNVAAAPVSAYNNTVVLSRPCSVATAMHAATAAAAAFCFFAPSLGVCLGMGLIG
jgi:hypothetical protein